MNEPQLRTADYNGLKQFAGDVMVRMRELDNMETSNMLMPDQANEILASMIESYIYAHIQTRMKLERETISHQDGQHFVDAFAKQMENFPKKQYGALYAMIMLAARQAADVQA